MENEDLASKFAREPARGERANLTGIYPQYRAAALLLLDALHKGRFEEARLADPKAGRVDDWQVLTDGRLDAFQFKWSHFAEAITLRALMKGKKGEEPIFSALASGWKNRKVAFENRKVVVHLATNSVPSTSAQARVTQTAGNELDQVHFAAFLEDSWSRVHSGDIPVPTGNQPWHDTWTEIRETTGLDHFEFQEFVRSCELHFPFKTDFTTGLSEREKRAWDSAVTEMTEGLLSLPSKSSEVVLGKEELLRLFGFREEQLPAFLHEFRLEDYVHEPLKKTADFLEEALNHVDRGYICLKGSPGSGKSSTLTLVLRGRQERVVHYYAFTPHGPNQTRGESENFLGHLVAELSRLGIRQDGKAPHKGDRHLLLERFRDQLQKIGREYAETGRKTLILIDGLDHIVREQHPVKSLLEDLPPPAEIPAGVVFVLGTQTTDFLDPGIQEFLRRNNRTIAMAPLSTLEIERVLRKTGILDRLNEIQRRKIVPLTGRHPLALRYLVRQLENCNTPNEMGEALEGQFPFDDDIQQYYRHLWNQIEKSGYALTKILSLVARLRKPADFTWLSRWANSEALDQIKRKFSHYFEKNPLNVQFFHNSFRIFILQLTSEDADGNFDASANRQLHAELAKYCVKSEEDSPWRWEEFFHLAEAGKDADALSLARPQWFRNQFLAMRPRDEISADLRKGFDLAAAGNSGLAAGRLALAEGEMLSRFEALDFDRTAMLSLLIRGQEAEKALGWIRSETGLKVSQDSALELVEALQEAGNSAEAERLFNLIEPSSALSPKSLNSGVRTQRKALVKWAAMAISFISFEEVLEVIRKFEFTETSFWDERLQKSVPIEQESERTATLASLAIQFEALDLKDLSARLTAEFDWNDVPSAYRIEYLLACLERDDGPIEEIVRMESDASPGTKLRIAELLAKRGCVAQVKKIFSELETPNLSYGAISGQEVEHERRSRVWLRIAYFLGEPISDRAVGVLPLAKSGGSKPALAAVHQLIAKLHASVWRGETVTPKFFAGKIEKVFETLHQPHLGRSYNPDISYEKPRIMEALVDSCIEMGQDFLTTLCRALDNQWSQPFHLKYWSNGLRREIVVNLCEAGAEKEWATKWLTEMDGQIDDSSAVGSRVSEYVAQAKAWLAAGEPARALASSRKGLQMSLGIGYHKDYQLSGWIEYLGRAWRDGCQLPKELISQMARTIVSLDGEIHGGATAQAAMLLVENTFRSHPLMGLRVWTYLTEGGAVLFPEALKVVLRAVVECQDEDPMIAARMFGELLIPLSEPDTAFLSDVLRKVHLHHGKETAQSLADLFALRVDTYSVGVHRNTWWRGLRRACGALGLKLPARQSPSLASSGQYNCDTTEETIALIYEARVPFLEFVRQKRAHDRNSAVLTQQPHIDWELVTEAMAPKMSRSQILICLKLFRKDSYSAARVGRSLTKRASEVGVDRELCSFGDFLLGRLEEKRDFSYVTEREVAPVFSIILSSDRKAGRKRMLHYLTHHQWLSPFSLPDVREGLLSEQEERSNFDLEVADHLRTLLEGSEGDAPELPLTDLDTSPPLTGSRALVRLIFSLLDHPTRIVHHSAEKLFLGLCKSGDSNWLKELEIHIAESSLQSSILGLLAQCSAEELKPCDRILRSNLPKAFQDGDLESRGSVLELASKLSVVLPTLRSKDSLSVIYEISLPRVEYSDLPRPLKVLGDLIACTSQVTQIPISNLYCRAEQMLAPLLASREGTLSTKRRRGLSWLLDQAGLTYSFTHPDRILGLNLGFRLLAELHTAGVIANDAIPEIRRLFSRQDRFLIEASPSVRPSVFCRFSSVQEEQAWSDEWLNADLKPPFSSPPILDDGWIVGGYRHRFRIHTDHLPVETHLGLLRIGPAGANHDLDYESHFQEEDQPREANQYYSWRRKKHDDDLFVLGGQSKVLPSSPWLALHPELGKRLEWLPDHSRMFGWKDIAGNRMVESRWWEDGPPDSAESGGNHATASGWVCVMSLAAWDSLKTLSAELYFDSTCGRTRS